MHTAMHWRTERGRYFQTHPLHATFSTYREHVASRAGCTGARLVRKVKNIRLPYGFFRRSRLRDLPRARKWGSTTSQEATFTVIELRPLEPQLNQH